MNILYINHYAGGPEYGMAFRPHYLASEWRLMGHKVTVVGASFSHLRTRQPNVGEEIVDGIRYVWLKTPEYVGNGLGRVKNILSFLCGLYFDIDSIVGEHVPDVVITSSTYPLDNCPGYRIAKKYKAKLIFEAHDLWPLSPMELGNMSKYHPFIMAMQFGEDYAYRHADKVVSILPCTKPHMCSHGLLPEKFVHIPNGINVSEWQRSEALPREHSDMFAKLRDAGKFIIGYTGGITAFDALEYLLSATKMIDDSNLSIVIVGKGAGKPALENYVSVNHLDNVIFLPPVDKRCVPAVLSQMDGVFIGWHKHSLYRFGISPNKIYDYMMAGKPIIHSVEAANDLVAEANCGISVPAEDPVSIADAIRKLISISVSERDRLGKNGKDFVIKNHDYKILAKKFIDAIMG